MTAFTSPTPLVSLQMQANLLSEQDPAETLDGILSDLPLNNVMVFHSNHLRRSSASAGGSRFHHPERCTDKDGRDLFDRLQPLLETRNLTLIIGMGEDPWGYQHAYPGYSAISMVDCYGQRHRQSCPRNREWLDFQAASIEDMVREHSWLEGMMFMHERRGPLANVFFGGPMTDGRIPYCFCEHCRRAGKERGLDPARAREGYRQLMALADAAELGETAPPEGWFISIWRLFSRYPEILAWDQLWWDGLHDYRAALTGAARMVKPDIHVGFHYQHATHLFNFLWRAGDDPQRIAEFADWVKPSLYIGCSGTRSRKMLKKAHATLFRDMPLSVAREFISWISGRNPNAEPDFLADDDSQHAFGAEWVRREISRLKQSQPRPVIAGLGIGVPGGEEAERPELLAECTSACFEAGADGIMLSREYKEMRPEIVEAVGKTLTQELERMQAPR